jgi:hypothetical protein
VWLPEGQTVRCNRWRKFDRTFSDKTQEVRYVREIILARREVAGFGRLQQIQTMPENSTWYVMTEIPGLNYKDVRNLYGCRNWVEYGLNQSKNELGWADFRLIQYQDIEKWWELVLVVIYLLACLPTLGETQTNSLQLFQVLKLENFRENSQWDEGTGWKNWLNNLRLISLPFFCFNLIFLG